MNLLARKLAHLLVRNANNDYFEDEIRYGLEIALGALLQTAIIIIIGLFLGLAKEVTAVVIAAALYRRYTGGPHCQAYYRCTITSLITYISLSYISRYIPASYLSFYITGIGLLSVLVIHYIVPVGNPRNMITDELQKKRMKIQSYRVLIILLVVTIGFGYFTGLKSIASAFLLGLFWQNFTLLSWGHIYIHLWDKFFDRFEKLFLNKEVIKC